VRRLLLSVPVMIPGLFLLAQACGGASKGSAPATGAPSPGASASSKAESAADPARPGHVPRAAVVAVLSRGLGAFLGRLETEPMLVGGRFHGWRIVHLADRDRLWAAVDLAPGDVVTSINGRPIERPEQALVAFQALAIDSVIRVTYERNNQPREILYFIDES
jgi:type II secretory pathway component PulC